MRALRFEFHPEQVKISSEEILADLRYPVPSDRDDGGRKRARRRPERRVSIRCDRDRAARTRTITWQDPVASAAVGAQMAGLDYVRAIQSGEIPPPPIAVVMNFSIDELEEGRAVFVGEPGEEHYNPIGVVHGGYASTILDSALGCSVHTTCPAGVGYTSQTLEVKYLRPDPPGHRRGPRRVRRDPQGPKTATAEAKLTSVETRQAARHRHQHLPHPRQLTPGPKFQGDGGREWQGRSRRLIRGPQPSRHRRGDGGPRRGCRVAREPGPSDTDVYRGRPAIRSFLTEFLDSWERFHQTLVDLLQEGDRVLVLIHLEATGRGSAASVDAHYAHLWTLSGGRGTRVDAFYDRDEALAALNP